MLLIDFTTQNLFDLLIHQEPPPPKKKPCSHQFSLFLHCERYFRAASSNDDDGSPHHVEKDPCVPSNSYFFFSFPSHPSLSSSCHLSSPPPPQSISIISLTSGLPLSTFFFRCRTSGFLISLSHSPLWRRESRLKYSRQIHFL